MLFTENDSDYPEVYKGPIKWKDMSGFATKKLQNFVSVVNSKNYQDFVNRESEKSIVLLFTEKKVTPPLFKSLSKQYKGRLLFGEVRKSDTELVKAFKITKFPSILVVTDPFTYEGTLFDK
jgi:hypothetical protein